MGKSHKGVNKNIPKEITCKKCRKIEVRTSNAQKQCRECKLDLLYKRRVAKNLRLECNVCHKIFKARQKNQKICSRPKCYYEYYRKNKKDKKLSESELLKQIKALGYNVSKKP